MSNPLRRHSVRMLIQDNDPSSTPEPLTSLKDPGPDPNDRSPESGIQDDELPLIPEAQSSLQDPDADEAKALTSKSNGSQFEDKEYTCICEGKGKDLDPWIWCDGKDCKVQWYHFGCTDLQEVPMGKWLCPSCEPYSIRRRRVQVRPHFGRSRKGIAITKPNPPQQRRARSQLRSARKGTAGTKPLSPKPKPQWKGWIEVSEEEIKSHKKSVEQKWSGI